MGLARVGSTAWTCVTTGISETGGSDRLIKVKALLIDCLFYHQPYIGETIAS